MKATSYTNFGWENGTIIVTDTTPKGGSTAGSNHGTFAIVVWARRSRTFGPTGLFVACLIAIERGLVQRAFRSVT
jgi:hypothetical protein